eukprot:Trichotokara_eunicae@DN99_c0_g1_i2.p1
MLPGPSTHSFIIRSLPPSSFIHHEESPPIARSLPPSSFAVAAAPTEPNKDWAALSWREIETFSFSKASAAVLKISTRAATSEAVKSYPAYGRCASLINFTFSPCTLR